MKLALTLLHENISPRNVKDDRVPCMSGMLLYYLDTKKNVKFNLPQYIVHAMYSISGRHSYSKTPGFGMMITRICKEKGINLNSSDSRIANFPLGPWVGHF